MQGWLYDVKNTQSPQVLGKQYHGRGERRCGAMMAHKFADEIIFRLGGGIQGIAETQIYFVSDRTGHKEIWAMDYDGSNQHQITHLGSISLVAANFAGRIARRIQQPDQDAAGRS